MKVFNMKKKWIGFAALFVLFGMIVMLCLVNWQYKSMRYETCIDDNSVLQLYKEGEISLVAPEEADTTQEVYSLVKITDELIIAVNREEGYIKTYRNGILLEMSVDNKFAELLAKFNPKYLIFEKKEYRKNLVFAIRNEEEYNELLEKVKTGKISDDEGFLKIEDQYFIN